MAAALRHVRGREIWMWLAVCAILVLSVTGIMRMRFDDALVRFFKSDVPAYDHYVSVARAFEGDSSDVIALFEAEDLAAPEAVSATSDFLLDAQLVPGVRAVISPFSLRITGDDGGERRYRIEITGRWSEFELPPMTARPREVVFNDLEGVLCEFDERDWH